MKSTGQAGRSRAGSGITDQAHQQPLQRHSQSNHHQQQTSPDPDRPALHERRCGHGESPWCGREEKSWRTVIGHPVIALSSHPNRAGAHAPDQTKHCAMGSTHITAGSPAATGPEGQYSVKVEANENNTTRIDRDRARRATQWRYRQHNSLTRSRLRSEKQERGTLASPAPGQHVAEQANQQAASRRPTAIRTNQGRTLKTPKESVTNQGENNP